MDEYAIKQLIARETELANVAALQALAGLNELIGRLRDAGRLTPEDMAAVNMAMDRYPPLPFNHVSSLPLRKR